MRPQFFPWLFDDKNAWEKVFADPRYSYEMPIDYFMAIYQVDRKYDSSDTATRYTPELSMTAMPMPAAAATFAPVPSFFATSAPVVAAAPAPAQEKSKSADGILSQEEIDALLSGI